MRAKHVHADKLIAIAEGRQMEIYHPHTQYWITDTGESALEQIALGGGDRVRIKPTTRVARRWWINVCDAGYAFASTKQAEIFSRGTIIESVPVIEILPEENAT